MPGSAREGRRVHPVHHVVLVETVGQRLVRAGRRSRLRGRWPESPRLPACLFRRGVHEKPAARGPCERRGRHPRRYKQGSARKSLRVHQEECRRLWAPKTVLVELSRREGQRLT
eukprot:2639249-Alexandrium_andersonii.AAC.1